MTTAAQIKKLVTPLLERNPDLALVGRSIFVKPVHHFARHVLIDRRGNPDVLEPSLVAVHLFLLWPRFHISWSEFIPNETSSHPGFWLITEPNVGDNLIAAIEKHALPVLRKMQTFEDYLRFVSEHRFRHHLYQFLNVRFAVEIAMGNLSAARRTWSENPNPLSWQADQPRPPSGSKPASEQLRLLYARLEADDRSGMAALLHEWERDTVRERRIEHLWEPTPFPLELGR